MIGLASPPSSCHHSWVRCPDRDSLKDSETGGTLKLYTEAVLVFYCEKCLLVETRHVTVDQ